MQRRTKIIATLGPAADKPGVLDDILAAGVDIVRLNFSHDQHQRHADRIQRVRSWSKKHHKIIGILADLQGPKIRVSSFIEKKVVLQSGQDFILDAALAAEAGTHERVGIDYKDLPQDVKPHDVLFLDDGRLKMIVTRISGTQIICRVEMGGELSNHKGINRLGGGLSAPALTPKDREDLKFVLGCDVDYIALSFPRSAKDVIQLKRLIQKHEGQAAVIAKIERTEAVEDIDAIIQVSDGVMVARGDLAIEIGDAAVPLVQKNIIHRARALDRPVIVATHMMESMIHNTVPTRAEVSDVATAVLDNVDAVMLSAETAVGQYPRLTVEAMHRVCITSEASKQFQISGHREECRFHRIDEAIAMATMYTANHLNITAIMTLTESGATPLWMSRIRTGIPIYALSRFTSTLGYMTLYRGVYPIAFDPTKIARDKINHCAVDAIRDCSALQNGDLVMLTKGDHMGVGGGSNAMKILVVGQMVREYE